MDKNQLKINYALMDAYDAIVNKDYKKSLRLCESISDVKLTKPEDIYYFNQYIGEAYLGLCQFRKAVQHFTYSIKVAKQKQDCNGESMSLRFRGEAYEGYKDYESAEKDYLNINELKPDGVGARLELAKLYIMKHKFNDAKEQLNGLINDTKDWPNEGGPWVVEAKKLLRKL